MTAETLRLEEARKKGVPWRQWGPYLRERQWGPVREDYSEDGNAWDYFSHDQARSRAYHWGKDGLAGISDDKQRLCFALALWNGKDAILKERVFGLTNSEANHGEDVKDYYFYLDSTPTHSYMKYLYKYPQTEQTNKGRGRLDPEYELIDTGIFNQDLYFDVFVEYAKASATDTLIEISIHNRGPAEQCCARCRGTLRRRIYADLRGATARGRRVLPGDHASRPRWRSLRRTCSRSPSSSRRIIQPMTISQ